MKKIRFTFKRLLLEMLLRSWARSVRSWRKRLLHKQVAESELLTRHVLHNVHDAQMNYNRIADKIDKLKS